MAGYENRVVFLKEKISTFAILGSQVKVNVCMQGI